MSANNPATAARERLSRRLSRWSRTLRRTPRTRPRPNCAPRADGPAGATAAGIQRGAQLPESGFLPLSELNCLPQRRLGQPGGSGARRGAAVAGALQCDAAFEARSSGLNQLLTVRCAMASAASMVASASSGRAAFASTSASSASACGRKQEAARRLEHLPELNARASAITLLVERSRPDKLSHSSDDES